MSPRRAKVLQTDEPSRLRFAQWLNLVINGEYVVKLTNLPSTTIRVASSHPAKPVQQDLVADMLGKTGKHGTRIIRAWLSAKKGPSRDEAYEVGENLARIADREWCGGIIAVSVTQMYRIHVLRWIGVLLSQNKPSPTIHSMWPLLANLATNPAMFQKPNPLPSFYWTDEMRNIARKAWAKIGNAHDPMPEGTPTIISTAISLKNAMGHSGSIEVTLAESQLFDSLHHYFDGIEKNWSKIKHF